MGFTDLISLSLLPQVLDTIFFILLKKPGVSCFVTKERPLSGSFLFGLSRRSIASVVFLELRIHHAPPQDININSIENNKTSTALLLNNPCGFFLMEPPTRLIPQCTQKREQRASKELQYGHLIFSCKRFPYKFEFDTCIDNNITLLLDSLLTKFFAILTLL